MRRGVEMQGRASACVRVRFQRHDALPYAFCFNFLEATGSISFASPSPLFFFSLFAFPLAVCSPIRRHGFRRHCSSFPRGSSAICTTVVFSTVDAARYIFSSSPPIPPNFPLGCFSPSSHAVPTVPTAPCLSRFPFPPIPFIPSSRRALSCRHPSTTE